MRVEPDCDDVAARAMNHVRYARLFRCGTNLRWPRAAPRSFYRVAGSFRLDYFLRKRSSRTTSAPSPGFAGSSRFSSTGAGTVTAARAAGRFAAGVSVAASDGSDCKPNCTEGSKKLLMALKGTTRRSAMTPKEKPTSKRSSEQSRAKK